MRSSTKLFSILLVSALPLMAQNTNAALAEQQPALRMPPVAANPSAHTALTGAIMQKLTNDPALGDIPITASVTNNGDVSLNGVVSTAELEQQVIALVKAIPGVKSVSSQLLVNKDIFTAPSTAQAGPISELPVAPTAEETAQSRLDQQFRANPALRRVSSYFYNDEIMLLGTVRSKNDVRLAEQLAYKAFPKAVIVNSLLVNKNPSGPGPIYPQLSPGGSTGVQQR